MGIISITLQDLRFRARQFLIAVIGAGLVFAMGILLSGLAAGFSVEITQTVDAMHAQAWVTAAGVPGRVAALPAIPAATAAEVALAPGVTKADPIIVVPQAAFEGANTRSLVMIGALPGGLGSSSVDAGHPVRGNGEAVVDNRIDMNLGQHFTVSGVRFTVVGTVSNRTMTAGVPDVYVTLHDAQAAIYGGRPLANAVLTSVTPSVVPPGMAVHTNQEMEAASLSQMAAGVSSISSSRLFMWVIAAFIVAALVYVTALERTRDFAVLKALGSSSGMLFVGLAFQAVLVALAAAAVAALISNFMTGLFAQPVDIPGSAFVILPLTALAVGILSSLAALRRAVSADPAVAFAG